VSARRTGVKPNQSLYEVATSMVCNIWAMFWPAANNKT
jgi:hypothetical protein